MRKVGQAIYGDIPTSTFEEALRYFQAAENLRPDGWKENRLFVAKCYQQLGDMEQCIQWLQQAREVSIITPDVSGGDDGGGQGRVIRTLHLYLFIYSRDEEVLPLTER